MIPVEQSNLTQLKLADWNVDDHILLQDFPFYLSLSLILCLSLLWCKATLEPAGISISDLSECVSWYHA